MPRRLGLILALALLAAPYSRAQQPVATPPSTGYILGRVVDAQSNTALPGVLVQISSTTPAPANAPRILEPRVLTDGEGRFLFRGVPAGTYTITAALGGSNGFVPNGFVVTGL